MMDNSKTSILKAAVQRSRKVEYENDDSNNIFGLTNIHLEAPTIEELNILNELGSLKTIMTYCMIE